jgi:hypothetical membrane protein
MADGTGGSDEFFGETNKSFQDELGNSSTSTTGVPDMDNSSVYSGSTETIVDNPPSVFTNTYTQVNQNPVSVSNHGELEYGNDHEDMSKPLYGATFSQAVVRYFKRYARFSGYSSRSEYWWVYLFNVIVGSVFAVLMSVSFLPMMYALSLAHETPDGALLFPDGGAWSLMPLTIIVIVLTIYSLATLVPTIALTVRRIRDTGRDWPWIFVGFVPYIGGLLILLLCAQKTDMSQHRPEWEDNSPGKPVEASYSSAQPANTAL